MININTQMIYGDSIVFYSIIFMMLIDFFITYIVLSIFKDIGKKDWYNQEVSLLYRPIMKHFGFKVWGWCVIVFDIILYSGAFYYFISIRNYEMSMRFYHFWAGVYFITLIGNFAVYKQVKKHPKYIKYLKKQVTI